MVLSLVPLIKIYFFYFSAPGGKIKDGGKYSIKLPRKYGFVKPGKVFLYRNGQKNHAKYVKYLFFTGILKINLLPAGQNRVGFPKGKMLWLPGKKGGGNDPATPFKRT